MRRILLILLCVCPLLARAGNTLTLSSASCHPGDVVTIEASMSGAEEVVACEWRIPLGQHLTYVPHSVELSATRSDGHSITAASYQDTLIVSIYSVAMKPIKGTEGVLFSFRVTMGSEPATYTLTPEVLLSSEEGTAVATTIQSGETTILSPKISILTPQVDFGHIPIRATYNQTLQVRNVGNEDLHITDVLISAAALTLPQSAWTIAPGQTQNITLTYNPVVRGAISETIRFRSDAINDADVYQASKVTVVADPFSVNELHVVGASGIADEEVTISLTVNNMEPLVGLQCSFVLPTALKYVENSVAVSARSAEHVAMSTLDGNKLTLMLYSMQNDTLKDHDGEVLTFRLRLNGTSGNYSLNPTEVFLSNIATENMTSAVYSASVHINSPRLNAPTSIQFGYSSVTEKVTAQYTIRNQGNATLTVERIAFLAEGFEVEETLPLQIAQNQTQTITVAYTPTVEGDYSTTMQVYSNDPTNRMHSVTLSGKIIEPNSLSISGDFDDNEDLHLFVNLDNYTLLTGVQFDIHCPDGLVPQSFAATNRLTGLQSTMQPIEENTYRVLVYSLSDASIAAGEGAIYKLLFAEADTKEHNHQPFSISDIYLSDVKGTSRLTSSVPEWVMHAPDHNQYTLTTHAENGTVDGAGEYTYGTEVVLTATPAEGYLFDRWSDGNMQNPRTVTVEGNADYTALFIEIATRVIFVSRQDGSTIGLTRLSSYQTIEYLQDGEWHDMTTATTIHLDENEVVCMRGKLTGNNTSSNYTQFTMSGSIEASGNINAIWDYENLEAPLKTYCGHRMFYGCTALTTAPDLPSTELATFCYHSMFYGCSSLVTVPAILPATTLKQDCYSMMFMGTAIVTAPELPALQFVYGSCYQMFNSCNNLRYIKCLATDISATLCHSSWVGGVATSGIFIKNRDMTSWSRGSEGIPTSWTVYNDRSTITFLDYDDTELQRSDLAYGELPTYVGDTPFRPEDNACTYTFAGWTPEVVAVTGDATYKATFNATKKSYTITWLNEDDSLIDETVVEYGVVPTHVDPVKVNTAEYTYTFAGWTPEVVAVTGDATYKATFNATKNSYTITWQNEDDSLIDQTTVEYSVVPTHANPVKANTAEYTYTFAGWTPEVVAVTGDATYKATFNATKNSYTITWQNEDGSLIDQTSVEYGVVPTHADPVKANTAEYTYTFAGWTPEVVAVTGNATYKATFNATKNSYTITWDAVNGEVEGAGEYAYGTEIELTAIPDVGYVFYQWSDGDMTNPRTITVTEDTEYTALFTSDIGTDVENGQTPISSTKILRNNHIFILRGEKVYTLQGQAVQ